MEKLYKIAAAHADYFNHYYKYKMVFWDKFDYSILTRNIMYYKKKGKWKWNSWYKVPKGYSSKFSYGTAIKCDKVKNTINIYNILKKLNISKLYFFILQ